MADGVLPALIVVPEEGEHCLDLTDNLKPGSIWRGEVGIEVVPSPSPTADPGAFLLRETDFCARGQSGWGLWEKSLRTGLTGKDKWARQRPSMSLQ